MQPQPHSSLIPMMFSPPESLLASCILRGNFAEAHQVSWLLVQQALGASALPCRRKALGQPFTFRDPQATGRGRCVCSQSHSGAPEGAVPAGEAGGSLRLLREAIGNTQASLLPILDTLLHSWEQKTCSISIWG